MFDAQKLKKTLSATYKNFIHAYEEAVETSNDRVRYELAPGQPMPDKRLQSEEDRNRFIASSANYRNAAVEALQKARDEFDAEIAAAPSTDAVNAISTLRLLEHPTKEEIMAAHAKYGDNYLVHRALAELANKHRYFDFPQYAVDAILEGFETMEDVISREFTLGRVMDPTWNPSSRITLFDMTLESCFPD